MRPGLAAVFFLLFFCFFLPHDVLCAPTPPPTLDTRAALAQQLAAQQQRLNAMHAELVKQMESFSAIPATPAGTTTTTPGAAGSLAFPYSLTGGNPTPAGTLAQQHLPPNPPVVMVDQLINPAAWTETPQPQQSGAKQASWALPLDRDGKPLRFEDLAMQTPDPLGHRPFVFSIPEPPSVPQAPTPASADLPPVNIPSVESIPQPVIPKLEISEIVPPALPPSAIPPVPSVLRNAPRLKAIKVPPFVVPDVVLRMPDNGFPLPAYQPAVGETLPYRPEYVEPTDDVADASGESAEEEPPMPDPRAPPRSSPPASSSSSSSKNSASDSTTEAATEASSSSPSVTTTPGEGEADSGAE